MELRVANRCEVPGNGRQEEQKHCKPEERPPDCGDGHDKGTGVTNFLTLRARRFTGCTGWSTESPCLAKILICLILNFHRPTVNC